jgi:hypothetical protein
MCRYLRAECPDQGHVIRGSESSGWLKWNALSQADGRAGAPSVGSIVGMCAPASSVITAREAGERKPPAHHPRPGLPATRRTCGSAGGRCGGTWTRQRAGWCTLGLSPSTAPLAKLAQGESCVPANSVRTAWVQFLPPPARFPPSSMPASIEISINLIVCLHLGLVSVHVALGPAAPFPTAPPCPSRRTARLHKHDRRGGGGGRRGWCGVNCLLHLGGCGRGGGGAGRGAGGPNAGRPLRPLDPSACLDL